MSSYALFWISRYVMLRYVILDIHDTIYNLILHHNTLHHKYTIMSHYPYMYSPVFSAFVSLTSSPPLALVPPQG